MLRPASQCDELGLRIRVQELKLRTSRAHAEGAPHMYASSAKSTSDDRSKVVQSVLIHLCNWHPLSHQKVAQYASLLGHHTCNLSLSQLDSTNIT